MLTIGLASAETITSKSGNSTMTITQEPGTNMKRKVIKTPDGQTIIQQSGRSTAEVTQGTSDDVDDKACAEKKAKKTSKVDDDDDCDDNL